MTIYHSSNCIVKKPDTKHSRKDLDFGIGFYVTTIKEQALQRLIYQKPNIQYCFCNDRIINQNISFIEAIII